MRVSRNTLNNMIMENQRKTPMYQAIITDLAIVGAIDKKDAEMLLGYSIPDYLKTPNGKCISDAEASGDLGKLKDIG